VADLSTLPGCIGCYGKPSEGNNCTDCEVKALCTKISEDFVPKARLLPIYERVLKLEKILTGVTV
jgi:hypothetical protein